MGKLALLFIATLIAIGHPSSVVSKAVTSTQADKNVPTDLNRAPSSNKTSESSLSPDQFIVPVIDQMTKELQTEKLCELITGLGHMCQAETDKDLKKKCQDTVTYAKTKAVEVQADCVKIDTTSEEMQSGRSSAALGKPETKSLDADLDLEYEEAAAFGSDDSDESRSTSTMDYDDPETNDFDGSYKKGEAGALHARKRIILFSVFTGLCVVAGLAVIVIAFVFSGLAFKKRSKRNTEGNNDAESGDANETGEPTNNYEHEENQAPPNPVSTLAKGTYQPN